jgi:hypothetical protein
MEVICPYCAKPAKAVTGAAIYKNRPDLQRLIYWQCKPCEAYVGCHRGTMRPLGRLANAQLRVAKMRAHAAFDPIWKNRHMTRTAAYEWLSKVMGLPFAETHIGMFDIEQCRKVIHESRLFFTKLHDE